MKVFTKRLGQFSICALMLTIAFRYALNLTIGKENLLAGIVSSIVYFGLMYFTGWHYGYKDAAENEIHDIGFRFHFITYVLCIAMGYVFYYVGWNTEPLRSLNIGAITWGIGLAIHFIFYILAQKNTIKGYAKEDIFQ